jgi:hypothetical protein
MTTTDSGATNFQAIFVDLKNLALPRLKIKLGQEGYAHLKSARYNPDEQPCRGDDVLPLLQRAESRSLLQ